MVNLTCDFIGQSVKSYSKGGKEQEGERQLWRRQLTFSLIQIDGVMCLSNKDPENIDWYLLFLAKASYYKGKS